MNIPSVPSAKQIKLKYLFGMNSRIRNNLYFLNDDEKIVYPGGYHAIVQDLKDNTQQFLSGLLDYAGISCMQLSPARKQLALGLIGKKTEEKSGQPAIEIYEVVTGQRKKTALVFDNPNVTKWVSISFGSCHQEKKYLASLSGGEGSTVVVYWYWEKGQPLCSIDLGKIQACEVLFNSNDINMLSIVGKKVFKCFVKEEKMDKNNNLTHSLKATIQVLNGPAELSTDFTCHTWMLDDCEKTLMIAGNSEGQLIQCQEKTEFQELLQNSPFYHNNGKPLGVNCICPSKNGFVVACDQLTVFIYKYNKDKTNCFTMEHVLKVKPQIENQIQQNDQIMGLAIAPVSGDKIICTLSNNTIQQIRVKKDYDEEVQSEQIGLCYHNGPIHAMDLCMRKPLIATCGVDKTIKIWNYEEKTLELNWSFTNEEPYALAFHPSGFHIVVAFQDKLRFMSINIHGQSKMDKNRHYKEIAQFKNCKEIKFSNGGQYFAAVNGTTNSHVIHVYKFYTGENPSHLILKAHLQKIKGLVWSKDDTVLASCGTDGQIYAWRIDNDLKHDQQAMRIIDFHQKSVQFSSIVMTYGCGAGNSEKDEQKLLASSNDKNVYVVDMGSLSSTPPPSSHYPLDYNIQSLSFPTSNKVLFGGIQDEQRSSGAIRCYLYPFVNGKCTDYQAHDERGVEKIRVTHDDKYLISAGKDGCLILFEIKDKDAKGQHKLNQAYAKPSQEILISRADLDDLKHKKEDQNTKLVEFGTNNPLNQKDEEDQYKELKEQLLQKKRQHNIEYNNMKEQKDDLQKKYEDENQKLSDQNNKEMEELESEMNSRQMQELEKYESAKRVHNLQISKNNTKKQTIISDQEKEAQQLEVANQSKLEELKNQREKIESDNRQKGKNNEESLKQIELENENELKNLVEKNQEEHHSISEQGLKAKTEVSFTNKKIAQQAQETQELEDQRKMYQEQKNELDLKKKELQREIEQQKQTIIERDRQIGDKERTIYDLKKRSQELEKFKFVLDHKIKELKRDIAPREEEIQRMKVETNRLDVKLKDFNNFNNILGTIVDELDNTQQMMKLDVTKLRQRIQVQKSKVKNFKNSVYVTAQHILDPNELKKRVVELKEKHSNDFVKSVEIDTDITAEYESQKKYLEKTVKMLKQNLQKDDEIHKQDNIRIIRENVALIKEINKLRGEIKTTKFNEKGALQNSSKSRNISQVEVDDNEEKQRTIQQLEEQLTQLREQNDMLRQQNSHYRANLQQ